MDTQLRILLVALGAALLAAPAGAQNAADAAGRWGLLGRWAENCAAAPANGNMHMRYVRQGERLVFERDAGTWRDANDIVRAVPGPDGALAVTIDFAKFAQVRTNVMVRGNDGRIRVQANYDDKGGYTVKDGVVLGTGNPTPWHTRCR